MVGDDSVSHLVFSFIIRVLCQLFGCVNDWQEEIGVKVCLTALHQAYQTLKTHTGIDVLLRKLLVFASVHFARTAVILGEDNVPDLNVTVVFNILKEELFTETFRIIGRSAVVIKLGVRSARTSSDFPEVVFCLADMGRNHADLDPEIVSFLIIRINGDIHLFTVKSDPLRAGQEFPCPGNRFLLEIVADGEVSEHFEECVVTGSLADILDIVGTD